MKTKNAGNQQTKEIFMDSLIFSLEATLPVFLVMILGYALKNTGLMKEEFVSALNKLNYNVTLPVLLFTDISGADFYSVWDTSYVLFCFFGTLFSTLCIWGFSALFLRGTRRAFLGEFVQASYRSSAAILGIAFIQNIYGHSTIGPLMILGTVPLYNVMAVLVLSFTAPGEAGLSKSLLRKTLLDILKNPIIISIFLGLAFSLLRIDLPVIADTTLSMVARTATPLALLALGGGFAGKAALRYVKPTLAVSFIKLLLQPAVFLPIAVSFGFRGEELVALLIMLGAPTTASCYIMAKNLKHDGTLTSSAVVSTTFLSSFTLTFWLFLLRQLGLV